MKMLLRTWQLYVCALALATITACAQLGVPTPSTFNERLAVAYGSVTQVRQTATTLLEAKKISADDAQNVLSATDNARVGLDLARKVSAIDPNAADSKLTAVRTALAALAAYLATKGG